ncbi:MAG TPA: ParA family protein [Paracoccaceae bacterium]|nr:ParA family protein [Paracoccaceae bacterium]
MTTILFAQQKGGAGKSTLLSQLAAHWMREGRRVAIVDIDPQRSAFAWARTRARSGRLPAPAALPESADWRASSDIRDAETACDLVLVDTPGRSEALGLALLERAGLVLIPCQPSMADVWATEATLKAAEGRRVPHLVVLNRCPPRGRVARLAEEELAQAGAPLAQARVGARSGFALAFMLGAGVTELEPSAKAADEIRTLAAEILGRLGA